MSTEAAELDGATVVGAADPRVAGVRRFLGVRYARAARFAAPDVVDPTGRVTAQAFAPSAPQLPASGAVPGDVTPAAMDEDCQFLNVWAPAAPGPHPVLVWFHGGGFLTGSTTDPTIDGARLAAHGPLVVVTVAYRLGALGYLGIGTTNCGLRDQAAALEWVQRHIAAFGGDRDRVTIAGESAGGGSVLHLMAAPAAAGTFRRAVVQSGATDYTRTGAEVGRVTEVVLEALAGDDPRTVPWSRILEVQAATLMPLLAEMARMPFHPCVDDFVTARPVEALGAGTAASVDLVIGTTADEMRLFLLEPALADAQMRTRVDRYLGRDGAAVVDAYRRIVGDDPMDVWAAVFTDREMLLPALAVADAHTGPTFRYLFTWEVAPRADGLPLRACHASDIPFPFLALDELEWASWSAATRDRPAADALALAMADAWCRFAATGDPGWPAYGTGRVQEFGPVCRVVDDPSAARRAIWSA